MAKTKHSKIHREVPKSPALPRPPGGNTSDEAETLLHLVQTKTPLYRWGNHRRRSLWGTPLWRTGMDWR